MSQAQGQSNRGLPSLLPLEVAVLAMPLLRLVLTNVLAAAVRAVALVPRLVVRVEPLPQPHEVPPLGRPAAHATTEPNAMNPAITNTTSDAQASEVM